MDYWDSHGILFLIGLVVFPRLTLLFSGAAGIYFSGLVWWLGWLFLPRFAAALIGSLVYWETNPILVMGSWLVALSAAGGGSSQAMERTRESRQSD